MFNADIVVIGGGVVGVSIAHHLLAKSPKIKLVLLEKEIFLGTQATADCTGGIRHQFSSTVNIALTKLSLPFFVSFEEQFGYPISFKQPGYLFLTASQETAHIFAENTKMQNDLGVPTQLLNKEKLHDRFPYLETSDLIAGTFCEQDGYADPYGVVEGLKRSINGYGGEIHTSKTAVRILISGTKVEGVKTDKEIIHAPIVVNAAGTSAAELLMPLGINIPVAPFRRQVFVSAPVHGIPSGAPLTVDMDTGFYFHREEKGSLLLGGTDKEIQPGLSKAVNWDAFQEVAASAVKRVPCLGEANIVKAYAGTRMMSADYHAIIGQLPEIPGIYLAAGFSGHGFMHAPAAGILLSEEILDGKATSMDTTDLKPQRFQKVIVREKNIF